MSDSTIFQEPPKSVAVSGKRDRLLTSGFVSLLSVSFLEAANDNLLKQILMLMVVTGGLWANQLGDGTQGIISLVLSVPFIFLSGYAGLIADKYSKQRVIFWVKVAEVPIAIRKIDPAVLCLARRSWDDRLFCHYGHCADDL